MIAVNVVLTQMTANKGIKNFGEKAIAAATEAGKEWRTVPAPLRGEVVRLYGEPFAITKTPWEPWFLMKWAKAFKKDLAKSKK